MGLVSKAEQVWHNGWLQVSVHHYLPSVLVCRGLHGSTFFAWSVLVWAGPVCCHSGTGSSTTAKSTAHPLCLVGVVHDISWEKIF